MTNILIHWWKWYKKSKYVTTYWYISIIKWDVLNMFDNAAKRIDTLLWYKKHTTNVKFKSSTRKKKTDK